MRPKFNYSSLQTSKKRLVSFITRNFFWHYGSKLNFSENGVRKILKRTPRLPQRQMSSYLGA